MRIALATSESQLPASDRLLEDALRERAADVAIAHWQDAACDWSRFDTVVVRSCWNYHHHLADFLAWLARVESTGARLVNPRGSIVWNADKRYLAALADSGVPIPGTQFVAPAERLQADAVRRSSGWTSVVSKPLVSASAWRTERDPDAPIVGPAMVQEYLPEITSVGEWSLVFFDGAHSHSVLKRPRDGDFRVQQERGGSAVLGVAPAAVHRVAEQVLAACAQRAHFARVDVVASDRGPLLMELELIEPELFLFLEPRAASRCAQTIMDATS
ncbi:MAG: RimK family alpha-L-glutamate ligase [Gemmatimonadaceae bacterium]